MGYWIEKISGRFTFFHFITLMSVFVISTYLNPSYVTHILSIFIAYLIIGLPLIGLNILFLVKIDQVEMKYFKQPKSLDQKTNMWIVLMKVSTVLISIVILSLSSMGEYLDAWVYNRLYPLMTWLQAIFRTLTFPATVMIVYLMILGMFPTRSKGKQKYHHRQINRVYNF
ncbi:MAG: hypothetical protein ACXAB7_14995 [Candidatus Kariarchaeaceae archaeon]|jgi:hypothetical protein